MPIMTNSVVQQESSLWIDNFWFISPLNSSSDPDLWHREEKKKEMLGTTIVQSVCLTFHIFKNSGKKLMLGKLNTILAFKYKTTP